MRRSPRFLSRAEPIPSSFSRVTTFGRNVLSRWLHQRILSSNISPRSLLSFIPSLFVFWDATFRLGVWIAIVIFPTSVSQHVSVVGWSSNHKKKKNGQGKRGNQDPMGRKTTEKKRTKDHLESLHSKRITTKSIPKAARKEREGEEGGIRRAKPVPFFMVGSRFSFCCG